MEQRLGAELRFADRIALIAGDGRLRAGAAELPREFLERFQDGAIAGAAAEVSVADGLHLLLGERPSLVRAEVRVEVHHPAGRAVAALGAVVLGDRFLRRIEAAA